MDRDVHRMDPEGFTAIEGKTFRARCRPGKLSELGSAFSRHLKVSFQAAEPIEAKAKLQPSFESIWR
jgi:hypothetical protein